MMKQLIKYFALALILLAYSGFESVASNLKVLVIGNSYSNDAFGFLPFVMNSACPDVSLTLGICMDGSQTIQGQLNHALNDTKYYVRYEKWTKRTGWVVDYHKSLSGAVDDDQWDWIVLHQASVLSCNVSTITPYLGELLDYFRNTKHFEGKIAWMIIPAFAEGTTSSGVNKLGQVSSGLGLDYIMTTDEMQQRIFKVSKQLLSQYDELDEIIPCGLGIGYARHTWLNLLGDWAPKDAAGGNLVYKDGHHLQYGVGNLIESWVATLSLTSNVDTAAVVTGYRWMNGDIMATRDSRNQPIPTGMDASTQQFARQCAYKAWLGFRTMIEQDWDIQVTLNQSELTMNPKEQNALNADVDTLLGNNGLEWSSNNPSIATVDSNGVVTARNPGICYVYASSMAQPVFFASCRVKVLHFLGDVNLDNEVSIADVTKLIQLILDQSSNENSDVNNDGETSIADVTSLVQMILERPYGY
ncbi:MAG: DUF4886 domain-containing protein [Muribaculaceae bacterium]|nr:DUF4886 domain-containing protein [Muribaculaceae bacterium]